MLLALLAASCRRESPEAGEALAAALTSVRPGEGRLSGAPWREPESRSEKADASIRLAVRASTQALQRKITVETLRDDAVARLLAGQVDAAIDGLSKAVEIDPSNAAAWSDLAAARLQRSQKARDPYEIVLALAAATRAVGCDPDFAPARFNRALALESLALHPQAAEEWKLLSGNESDPSWQKETRRHVAALAEKAVAWTVPPELSRVRTAVEQGRLVEVQAIVAASPQRFREHLEWDLLPAWAKGEAQGREAVAAKELSGARAIADALTAAGGDRMSGEVVAHLYRAAKAEPQEYRRLVEAFLAYSEGLDLLSRRKYSLALHRFSAAEAGLVHHGSPFAAWAGFQVAFCLYQSTEYDRARARAFALAREPRNTRYKALQGRALQLVGMIDGIRGRLTASVAAFEEAEAAFREIREVPQAAKLSALLAGNLDILGQRKEAWRRLHGALTEPAAQSRADIWFPICETASWLAQGQGKIEIALWFQNEVVRSSEFIGPDASLGALRQRAVLLAALGRRDEAAEDLKQARSYLQQIPELRRILEGDLLLVESELAASTAPEQAVAKLDSAIEIFRDTSYHYRLGDALYRRALVHKTLGHPEAAERDLADAIAELERQRETVDSAEYRISYLDRVKDIFDTMIELQIEERQQPVEALRVSEQARARVLWDWMIARPTGEPGLPHLRPAAMESFNLGVLQRGIPEGTAVVEYAVLPRKIVVWILRSRGDLRWEREEIESTKVEDLVQKLRRALLEDRSAELEPLAEQAYDLLIRPVESHLGPGERLVLVPDGPLHALPFSVLRDSKTGRYLFQDRVLAVAPSIRVYVESLRRDRALARGSGNVLVVAAPEFDPRIDPTLPPLTAGETEASIAGIFPGRVLRGREATRQAFLDVAPDFELVHFGGHSVVNVEHPLLSQMLFAKDPADPSRGVLYSGDVLLRSFPRTRLVVLASCGTAVGKISRTEGIENLARPFLAAGVPTVVASLWSVEDQATADFFVRFYRNLKQDHDVARALQTTQIESFDQDSSPRVWAAFETIGGGVEDARSNYRPAPAGAGLLPTSERLRKAP